LSNRPKDRPRRGRDRDSTPTTISADASDLDSNSVDIDHARVARVIPVDRLARILSAALFADRLPSIWHVGFVTIHYQISIEGPENNPKSA
jgi:hypothetical protein